MPFIVALTGGICSGKTTVSNFFKQLDVPVIDADDIAKQLVTPHSWAFSQIVKHFSDEILLSSGELDRSQLREIIFNNDHERLWLNSLLHPLIKIESEQQIRKYETPYIIWVVPLLIENHLQTLADNVLVIDVNPKVQLSRLMARDEINEMMAKKMILSQMQNEERLLYADQIIKNDGNKKKLKQQVIELHNYYLTVVTTKAK